MAGGLFGLLELQGVWLSKPPVSADAVLERIYLVDWDDDGDFDEDYEDITAYVKTARWSIGMDEPYQSVGGDTRLTLMVDNFNREFSPENSGSPFYGEIEPQRLVKVVFDFDSVEYTMYLGYLGNISVQPGDGRTAVLTAVGPQEFFNMQQIRMPLLENKTSGEVIEAILGRLQLPAALNDDIWVLGVPGRSELGVTTKLADLSVASDLDTGLSRFAFVSDNWDSNFHGNQYVGETWEDGFNGMDGIVDVVRAERGKFFFDRDGKAVFMGRDRLQTATTLQATFDMGFADDPDYVYGADVANRVRVMVYPRAVSVATNSLLWQLDEPVTIGVGDEHSINVRYSDEDKGLEIAAKDAYIDLASIVHNGTAVNFLPEFESRGATLTIRNDDPQDVMLTGLAIKGKKLTTYNEVEIVRDDVTSLVQRGLREYSIDCKLLSDVLFAEAVADYELNRRKTPRGEMRSITIQMDTPARMEQAVLRRIGDRIRVIDDQTSHDADYFIIGEEYDMPLRAMPTVKWTLEPADGNQYWLLGLEVYWELGVTTKLAL